MASSKKAKLSGIQTPAALAELERMTPEAKSAEQEATLRERALLVRFSIGRWYGSGADEQVLSELREAKGATGEIGSFTKRLMKRAHLSAINGVTSESRRYHKMMTLPWGDSGARILSVEAYREYKEQMSKYEVSFFAAVDAFIEKYPALVAAEQENLNDLWKESDYPSPEEMRQSFRFGLSIDILPNVQDMRVHLSSAHAEEIRVEIEKKVHASLVGAVGDIYERLREEVESAKEKLDSPDGRLQSKMFSALQGVVELLPKLNIAGDPRLTMLGRELQKELVALPVDTLRDDPVARKSASAKASKMLDAISALKGATKWQSA